MEIRMPVPHFLTGLGRPSLISGSPGIGSTCLAITPLPLQSVVVIPLLKIGSSAEFVGRRAL